MVSGVSTASGQKSGGSNRIRDFGMTNVECRIKEFFQFYLLKRAERSDIHNSSIIIRHSLSGFSFFAAVPLREALRGDAQIVSDYNHLI